jgi:NADH-quinone oxidoreductase subunit N
MLAEIFRFRKLLIPLVIAGLSFAFYTTLKEWNNPAILSIRGIDISHMIVSNRFSAAFTLLSILISALLFVLSYDYYKNDEKHLSDYLSILVFALCGAIMLFNFNNLTMLFLGIEILSISFYIMAGSKRFDVRSNESGFKYFLLGAFASCFLLFGIALVFGAANSFQLDHIAAYSMRTNPGMMFYTGMILILFAMLFKVAAVPFHFWSPDVYEGAPALITAFMSTLVKIAAFGAFYRLFSTCFIGTLHYAEPVLSLSIGATLIIANLSALHQSNFKRLLAFSGISHAGYLLLGIISIPLHSASAIWFYAAGYALASIAAFAVAIIVFTSSSSESIDAFNGLARKKPLLAFLLSCSMLSMAGIPPFAGFLGKYYLFTQAISVGYMSLSFIAIAASIVGAYYYLKVIVAMYAKPTNNDIQIEVPLTYIIIAAGCVAGSLLLGLFPDKFMHLI